MSEQQAFPHGDPTHGGEQGMTLRDYFAGQALMNPMICTGTATEYQLSAWFGNRTGIRREEIMARQATICADAMLAERARPQ